MLRVALPLGVPSSHTRGISIYDRGDGNELDAARLLTWRAAISWDRGLDNTACTCTGGRGGWFSPVKIAKSAATIDAVPDFRWGRFYQDHPAEMWMRNAAWPDRCPGT